MFQQAISVLLVLALLAGTLWFLRSRGFAHYRGPARRKAARHLETIARVALAPQHSVHLVRVLDHAVVLAVSPSGCTVIENVPWSDARQAEASEAGAGALR